MKKRFIIWYVLGIFAFLIGGYFIYIISITNTTNNGSIDTFDDLENQMGDVSCSTDFDDLEDQLEYVSCSEDKDCIGTSCGCLNNLGRDRLEYLINTCNMAPMCATPSNCYCVEGRCSSYKVEREELTILTDKPGYSKDEQISFQIINNYNKPIYYLEPCNNFFNLTTYSRETGWISVQKSNLNECDANLVELASKDKVRYRLNPEMYDFNPDMDTHRIIVYYSLLPLQTFELQNIELKNTFFSSNNFKIN